MMKRLILSVWIFLLVLLTSLSFATSKETRGLGIYPGDPNEDYAPLIIPDTSTHRNLALNRPAYHSSSYDYNLTAQLVADGINVGHKSPWGKYRLRLVYRKTKMAVNFTP